MSTVETANRSCWQAQPHRTVPEHVAPRRCNYPSREEYRNAVRIYEAEFRVDLARLAAASAHAGMLDLLSRTAPGNV